MWSGADGWHGHKDSIKTCQDVLDCVPIKTCQDVLDCLSGSGTASLFEYQELDPNQNLTNAAYVLLTTLNFVVVTPGDYFVDYTWEISISVATQQGYAKCEVDAVIVGEMATATFTAGNDYTMCTGFKRLTLAAGPHNIKIYGKKKGGAGNAQIRRIRTRVFKIA